MKRQNSIYKRTLRVLIVSVCSRYLVVDEEQALGPKHVVPRQTALGHYFSANITTVYIHQPPASCSLNNSRSN